MADHRAPVHCLQMAANPRKQQHHTPHLRNGEHEMTPHEAALLLAAALTNFSWLWFVKEMWFE